METTEAARPVSVPATDFVAATASTEKAAYAEIAAPPTAASVKISAGGSPPTATPVDDEEAAEVRAAEIMKSLADMEAKVFFEKSLTTSDASGSGRVVIPKAIAEQHFPKLEAQVGVTVEARDTRGHVYNFRFRFWINNQSRMYLLEGAGECHERYHLKTGDVMIFAQQPSGALVVAGRPCTKADAGRKLPSKRGHALMAGGTPQGKSKDQKKAKQDSKRRKAMSGPTLHYLPGPPDQHPPSDGVFRALPGAPPMQQRCGVTSGNNGRWVASVSILGELYQAFFDCQEDALEAFNAAGELLEYTGAAGAFH